MNRTSTSFSWTEERVALMKRLWAEGLSASQIAGELGGGVSRNAVIGKLHRSGMNKEDSGRPKATRKRAPRRIAPAAADVRSAPGAANRLPGPLMVVGALPDEPVFDMPAAQRLGSLFELTPDTCRWPVGDPAKPDFFFCGGRSTSVSPYCSFHTDVACVPAAARRRVNRPYPFRARA